MEDTNRIAEALTRRETAHSTALAARQALAAAEQALAAAETDLEAARVPMHAVHREAVEKTASYIL